MDKNTKTVQELEIDFLNLKIENEQKMSRIEGILKQAEIVTEKRVRIIFTWTIPIFAIISIGMIIAAFISKT